MSATVSANDLIAPAQRRTAYFAAKLRLTGVVVTLAECRVSAHGSHDSVPRRVWFFLPDSPVVCANIC
jgi:hypothetical protein